MTLLLENINRIIQKSMEENHIPGAAVAVIKDNEILLSQGYGNSTVEEWGIPIRPNTLFRIASVSKLFTGTVIMRLVEKGFIDLDKPIHEYIPWFTTATPELSNMITTRMLLSHSSGLPTGGALSPHYRESGLLHYMKEVVPTLPVLFYPGTAYSYGNHGLNIAGFVAEQVTGQPFEELMQELLFDPLEMTQTTYNPLKAMTYPLALPHDKDEKGNLAVSHQFYDDSASYPSYYSFSSIEDLSKFAMMHLQEGVFNNQAILDSSSIHEMRNQHSKWFTPTDAGCGITFFQENKNGIERYWHYGQYSHQYSSQFILIPEKGMAVIALANGENIFQAGYEIVDELLKDEPQQKGIPVSLTSLAEPDWPTFEGCYLHSYYGLFHVYVDSGKPSIKHNDQVYELTRYHTDTYAANDELGNTIFTLGFPSIKAEQTVKCIMVNSKACPEFKQEYIPNPSYWNIFEGSYSDGKDSFEVSIQVDSLIIKVTGHNEIVGRAIAKNQFLTKEFGLIRFIEIDHVINLEFDFAWRYPKQGSPVLA
jgi:CubicO group peptidase (beta-lactamase class C family)